MNLIPRDTLFDFDRFFNGLYPSNFVKESGEQFFSPRVDIEEQDNSYVITAELAGVDKDDLHVSLEDGILTINAKVEDKKEEKEKGKVIRQERRYGSFQRSFNLGKGVQESDISATFKDGLLHLNIPKPQEKVEQARRIPIS